MYDLIAANKRRTIILMLLYGIVIALLGYGIGVVYGNPFVGIILAAVIAAVYMFFSALAGDRVILQLNSAQPADPKKYPYLVNTVEGLAIAAGIPTPKIYVIEDTAINAFATGRNPHHASITVTTGALQRLKRDELEGVIAHEMSHIKNYDIRYMLVVVMLVGITLVLSDIFLRSFRYGGNRKSSKGSAILLLIGIVLAILSPIIVRLMQFAVSRQREFLADASGALLTRYPPGLANALKKIRDDKEPLVEAADRSTAHLYIENPLVKTRKKFSSLWSTHPDINERIKRLEHL